jgi:epsilon-lactone hydrolase
MISLRARLLFWLVRVSGLKNRMLREGAAEKFLAHNHARGAARPGRWFRKNCSVDENMIDGRPFFQLTPKDKASSLHIFYLHGGGYAFNITSLHWRYIKKIMKRTGASFSVPLYPLSPEHKWDESYAMVMQAYKQVVAKHGADNIVFMGDSAGGGFSLGLSQTLRNDYQPQPKKLVLLSPYLDQTAADPQQLELEKKDILISVEGIRRLGSWWTRAGENPDVFPVSPLFAPIDNLPPMQVFAGTDEVLLSDSKRLKQKGEVGDADIDLRVYDGMQHVWMLLPIREAKQAIDEIAKFLLAPEVQLEQDTVGFAEKELL